MALRTRRWSRFLRAILLVAVTACGGGSDQGGDAPTGPLTPPVATVTVSPAALWMGNGESNTLAATLRDAAGNPLTGRTVAWTSSNASLVSVSTSGQVTSGATGAGPVTITATSEGRSVTAQLNVVARFGTSTLDVTYCSPGGVDQKLDLSFPRQSTTATYPIIVYIHGGQLISGDKSGGPATPPGMWRSAAIAAGYAFASINYRLGPTYRFPAMIEDAKCAIRYLRANAAALGIDASRIGVTGTSSGGYLAALIGVTDTSVYQGTGGHEGVSSRVRAVVNEYGANMNLQVPAYGPAELECRLDAYPQPPNPAIIFGGTVINHVTADDPPFLTVHGDKDPHANPQGSIDLHDKLRSVGVSSTLQWIVNGGHGWSPNASTFGPISPTWPQIVQMEIEWFDSKLKG